MIQYRIYSYTTSKKGGVEESNLDVAIKEAIAPNKIIITYVWLELRKAFMSIRTAEVNKYLESPFQFFQLMIKLPQRCCKTLAGKHAIRYLPLAILQPEH
jgi:hypothetical protein